MKRQRAPNPTRVRDQALRIAHGLLTSDAAVMNDIASLDGLTDEEVESINAARAATVTASLVMVEALLKHRRDNKP